MRASPVLRRFVLSRALVLGLLAAILTGGIAQFVWQVAALRALHANGPNWSFPSRVFSNGVPLTVGRTAPESYLLTELAARGYRPVTVAPTAAGTYAREPGAFDIALRGFPDEPDPEGSGGPEHVRVVVVDGRIAAVERRGGLPGALAPDTAHPPRLEPMLVSMIFDQDRVWRSWVSLERVPVAVRDAIVASEDRRFYGHLGFDPRGYLRALAVNVRSGAVRQGGSTITQQLARGLFLGRDRNLFRKLAEVPLAVGLEILLSKQQILEMYLNSVYWGQANGFAVGGVAQAARWYFDAPIESLGVLEGATLAAMIPAPNTIDPFKDPGTTLEHRNAVLHDLVETGKLTAERAAALALHPLNVRRGPSPVERFPSYTGYVHDHLDHRLSRNAVTRQGLSIFTTMDLGWQEASENAIESGLAGLDASSRRRNRLEGAFVALEPTACSVVAMVGGRAVESGNFNRAYQARRQTGSAIKPIVYAAALTSPQGFTPATTLPDTLRTYGKGRWSWRPRNYDGTYHVEVTLAKALEKSLNAATTSLVERIGPHEVAAMAGAFGLGRLKPVLSIGLGSNEVSLLDLTNAFAVFAAHGMLRSPSPIRNVVDRTGRVLLSPPEEARAVIPEGVADLMTGLLENVVRYGVAAPLRWVYGFDRPVAGKTGTTNDFRDAWFVGFTPDVVAGVWVGYDRPRSIGRPAANTALPLWARAVGKMLEGFPPIGFAGERQLEWVDIDPWTGCLADSLTPRETVPFLFGTGPIATCGPDDLYGYEFEQPDSAAAADTMWIDRDDVEENRVGPEIPSDFEEDSLRDSIEEGEPR